MPLTTKTLSKFYILNNYAANLDVTITSFNYLQVAEEFMDKLKHILTNYFRDS